MDARRIVRSSVLSAGDGDHGEGIPSPIEPRHSLGRSLWLHLAPGALGAALYFAAAPLLIPLGIPPLLTLVVVLGATTLPIELVHLFRLGRAANGRLSLAGVVLLDRHLGLWKTALWAAAATAIAVVALVLLTAVDALLLKTAFSWLPAWAIRSDPTQYAAYSRSILLATFALVALVNCIAGPVIEELYFRGYLLPRLSHLGKRGGWIHQTLFTLYHLWQPWQYVSVFAFSTGLVWFPWRTRSVRVGIAAHIATNLIGTILTAGLVLQNIR